MTLNDLLIINKIMIFQLYLTSRNADIVIRDEPSTRKASHPFAASIAVSALSLGTLSPKKTTFKK